MTTILLILILITGYSAIQIVGEIIESKKCPDDKTLKKVVLGRMRRDTKKAKIVTKHLGVCSECRQKVDVIMKNDL